MQCSTPPLAAAYSLYAGSTSERGYVALVGALSSTSRRSFYLPDPARRLCCSHPTTPNFNEAAVIKALLQKGFGSSQAITGRVYGM